MSSILGSLFGGSGGTSQNVNQSSSSQTHYSPQQEAFVNSAIGKAQAAADAPYKPYDVDKMFAGFSPDQQQGYQQIRDLQGSYQPLFNQATGALNRVSGQGYDPLTNAQPYLDRAGNAINPWQAGSGAIGQSMMGWNTPGVAQSYMDPYTEGAINRANDLSVRGFSEKTLPALNAQFVKGQGQLGRQNYQNQMARSTRDLSNEMSGNADTMMDKSYWNAANAFQADQNRTQSGGVQLGALANNNMTAQGNLADLNSRITQGAVSSGIGLGNAYGQQATNQSGINLSNTGAMIQAGKDAQAQAQLPLTARYNQYMQETARPFDIANFMGQFVKGLPVPTSTTGTQNTTTTGSSTSTPSIMGDILGTASAVNTLAGTPGTPNNSSGTGGTPATGGLSNLWNWGTGLFNSSGSNTTNNVPYGPPASLGPQAQQTVARGGMIRHYAQGGPAFGPLTEPTSGPRGVLSRRHSQPHRFAVGGSVPVQRGILQSNMPQMPPGALGGMPPGMPPGVGMPPGMPPQMPPGVGMPPGALGMMR